MTVDLYHTIRVTSVQEYRTNLYPSQYDADEDPEDMKRPDFELHREAKITFECRCGKRFRKWRTAFEHLLAVKD